MWFGFLNCFKFAHLSQSINGNSQESWQSIEYSSLLDGNGNVRLLVVVGAKISRWKPTCN